MAEYKQLNETGEKIPSIGIGTWKMGENPKEDVAALKAAINHGMNFIDTAEMYGSEWIVGKALEKEKEVFLATKVSPNHFRYDDIIKSCDASLRNLGVKHIDLYQLHWPNHSLDIKETMRAMEKLVDDGKISYIGVSNFTVKEMLDAQEALKKYDIVSNQVEYSLLMREIERQLLDFCTKNKITVIAYSPFGSGALFSSKYRGVLEALERIGAKHRKTATQVALNWLISKKQVVAIPKAGDRNHAIENAGAWGWKLSREEMSELNSLKERKSSMAGGLVGPILKSSGLWAGMAHHFYVEKAHSNRSTTRFSKK